MGFDAMALATQSGTVLKCRLAAKAIRLDVVVFRHPDDFQPALLAMRLAVSQTPLISGQLDLD